MAKTLEATQRVGVARRKDICRAGGHDAQIKLYVGVGFIRRLAPGLYLNAAEPASRMAQAAAAVPHGVFCLLSALWLYGFLEREPEYVFLAVGEHARISAHSLPFVRYARMSDALLGWGAVKIEVEGVPARLFVIEKTVADLFRFRRRLGSRWGCLALDRALGLGRTPAQLRQAAAAARAAGAVDRELKRRGL